MYLVLHAHAYLLLRFHFIIWIGCLLCRLWAVHISMGYVHCKALELRLSCTNPSVYTIRFYSEPTKTSHISLGTCGVSIWWQSIVQTKEKKISVLEMNLEWHTILESRGVSGRNIKASLEFVAWYICWVYTVHYDWVYVLNCFLVVISSVLWGFMMFISGVMVALGSAREKRHLIVMSPIIGWAYT